MVLEKLTWRDVEALDRSSVVVIPTGSLEQHGPALPLFTDTYIVTTIAEAVEQALSDVVLLTPTLWLGASGHHLSFPGTLSASFEGYMAAVESVVESLVPHGFGKFYTLNGHGGNTAPNSMVLRTLKQRHPNLVLGEVGCYDFVAGDIARLMEGPQKEIRHACEAETSLMMFLKPESVRTERLANGSMQTVPQVRGGIHTFDEITEEGVLGYPKFASPAKGKAIFDCAVAALVSELRAVAEGYVFTAD